MGNLTTNCIAYWDFDESRSLGILKDLANNHDLTQYNSPQVTDGRIGFARKIQSANETYLTTVDTADLSLSDHTGSNHAISIAAWVKWDRYPTLTDSSTNSINQFAGSITKMQLDTTASEEYRLSWRLNANPKTRLNQGATGANLTLYMQVFDPAGNQNTFSALTTSKSAALKHGAAGRDGTPDVVRTHGSIEAEVWYLLIGTWERVSATYGRVDCHIYQGRTTDGEEANVIWGASRTRQSPHTPRALQLPVRPDWADTYNGPGTVGIGRWWSGSEYYEDFDIDSLGIWDYELTYLDRAELYNGGYGADYPFLDVGSDMYTPIPGPVIYPVPHSLYQGFSWNSGETPVSPAPNGWWSVQPTLPAWHVPPRIQGWAYDNPLPRPAPIPSVSQWRLQASEPVDNRDERVAKTIASFAPPVTSISSETPVVITPPPPPPAPPLGNSEAIVSDDVYRPGRADSDSSGYERS